MTLQSSASPGDPLTMGEVKTELGVSGTLQLTDSVVRTLFGVPSGTISLLQGLGKSNITRWYATSYAGTATSPTNAYDKEITDQTSFNYTLFTTAAVVNSPTASNEFTEFILYFGPITSKVMKLVIAIDCSNSPVTVPTYYIDCGTGSQVSQHTINPSPSARCTIEISTDGGNSWTPQIDVSISYAKYYTNLGGTFYTGNNIALRFRAYGQGIGSDIWYDVGSGCDTYAGTVSSSSSITIFTALLE
jgi:hypothetical protein